MRDDKSAFLRRFKRVLAAYVGAVGVREMFTGLDGLRCSIARIPEWGQKGAEPRLSRCDLQERRSCPWLRNASNCS